MFEQCLYFNTTSLARRLEREWSRAFKPFGLTPPQAFMLRVILEKPSISATDLSLALHISKATCSRTADGLVGLGFVRKLPADQDGRSCGLHPTAAAQEIGARLNEASAEVTAKIKKIIGEDAFGASVQSMRGIRASMK